VGGHEQPQTPAAKNLGSNCSKSRSCKSSQGAVMKMEGKVVSRDLSADRGTGDGKTPPRQGARGG